MHVQMKKHHLKNLIMLHLELNTTNILPYLMFSGIPSRKGQGYAKQRSVYWMYANILHAYNFFMITLFSFCLTVSHIWCKCMVRHMGKNYM